MKTADVIINLEKHGHNVWLKGVTPAELQLLVAEHHANAGGKVVEEGSLVETEDVERTPAEEVERLRGKYAGNKVVALYPGASPNMPESFDEAIKVGPTLKLPTSKLTQVKLM
jgi:(2Fe-2S) ferredoxin